MQEPLRNLVFTDASRAAEFKSDQQAWEQDCRKLVDTLKEMMLQKKPFNEIFEFARKWRQEVAGKLGHNTRSYKDEDGTVHIETLQNNFGKLRTEQKGDNYIPLSAAQPMKRPIANEILFNNLVKIIEDQNLPLVSEAARFPDEDLKLKKYYQASDGFEITLYVKDAAEQDQEKTNRIHYAIFHFPILIQVKTYQK